MGKYGNADPEQQKSEDEAKREANERRQMMLSQILTSEARVSEERLISLLEQINVQTTEETKETIRRRPSVLDDDYSISACFLIFEGMVLCNLYERCNCPFQCYVYVLITQKLLKSTFRSQSVIWHGCHT